MKYPRRKFLWFAGATSGLALGGTAFGGQGKRKFPEPPPPAEKDDANASPGDTQSAQLAQLKLNEKEFRESLTSLYQRVGELKQDLESVHTAQVFSLKVYKQTGEIEHLAKKLRNLAKI